MGLILVDLNLLYALDALLTNGTVVGAAKQLGLSESAMSRALSRLRQATGDQLFVRAGRNLVPTPHALELQASASEVTRNARRLLSPVSNELDLLSLERTFVLRTNSGFIEAHSSRLVAAVSAVAPLVSLRFVQKQNKNVTPLREGQIDIEIGVLGDSAPEIRTQALFRDRFVGAARALHPLLAGELSPETYAACDHVVATRNRHFYGPVDQALATLGLSRRVVVMVPGFSSALSIAAETDLVALVTQSSLDGAGDGAGWHKKIVSFELPVSTPEITISQMWHPRMDSDPAHKWLRSLLLSVTRRSLVA